MSFRVLGENAGMLPDGADLPADGVVRNISGKMRLAGPRGIRIDLQDARFCLTPVGITLQEGRSGFLIPQPGTVFSVITPVAVLGVQGAGLGAGPGEGSRFQVTVQADGTTLATVQAGRVEMSAGSGETRMLGPGDRMDANGAGTPDFPSSEDRGPARPETGPPGG